MSAFNISASWLCGRGAVPTYNLMEDAATAEISRAQLWQWIRHPKGILDDGRKITVEMYQDLKAEELREDSIGVWEKSPIRNGRFEEAIKLFDEFNLTR